MPSEPSARSPSLALPSNVTNLKHAINETNTTSPGFEAEAEATLDALDVLILLLPGVHLIILPLMALRKYRHGQRPMLDTGDATATTADDDEDDGNQSHQSHKGRGRDMVIFSHELPWRDRLVKFSFGTFLAFVSLALRLLRLLQIDLTSAWFPEPFWRFYIAKLELRSYRIHGRKLRFDARQEDAYIKFQYEALMNFYTLGLFKWCCGSKISYDRWLDTHIQWSGDAPPTGYNKQFRIFHTRLSCKQQLRVAILALLLSPFYLLKSIPIFGALMPLAIIGMLVDVYRYRVTLRNYRFGGSQPHFDQRFTFWAYVRGYYGKTFLGVYKKPLTKWVDSCIVMGTPVLDPAFEDGAPSDEPSTDRGGAQMGRAASAKRVEDQDWRVVAGGVKIAPPLGGLPPQPPRSLTPPPPSPLASVLSSGIK